MQARGTRGGSVQVMKSAAAADLPWGEVRLSEAGVAQHHETDTFGLRGDRW